VVISRSRCFPGRSGAHEFSGSIVFGGGSSRGFPGFISFDPEEFSGADFVQFIDVSHAFATANHEAESAGKFFIAATALFVGGPVGICVCPAFSSESDSSHDGLKCASKGDCVVGCQREHAARRVV
jgi:hypothetical protein